MRKDRLIGDGNLIVSSVGQGDREGVGIYKALNHGMKTGDIVPTDMADKLKDEEPEVVIWFKDMDAVRLFQDQVNGAALRMNGYTIENQEESN